MTEPEEPIQADDVRRIVDETVAAQVAPLREGLDAMGETLVRVAERLDREEAAAAQAGPAPTLDAAGIQAALVALAEGIRAVHDVVRALDERLWFRPPVARGGTQNVEGA